LDGEHRSLDAICHGALNAGLDALLFNRWQIPQEEITQAPTFVVDSLRDIKNIL
jgi:putative hydrolase of the HAD superfamily